MIESHAPVIETNELTALVGVVPSASTYNIGGNTYIICSGAEIGFTAIGSSDPNGDPLTYIWTFGDGGTITTTVPQVTHTYLMPNLDITMLLTVQDVSMNTANASLTLKIDGVNPTAVVLANGSPLGTVINIDQLRYLDLSASSSYDLIYNEAVPQGIIKRYDWAFGDGSYANDSAVARHAYLEPGLFNLTSTITDAIGRFATTVYAVQVRDITSPAIVIGIFRVADGAPVSGSTFMGDMLLFDGSNSTDQSGIVSYSWIFGDGATASDAKVEHAYAALGTITGRLTCVDAAGNSGFRTFSLTILPRPGPDLRLTGMIFSPATFIESTSGTVQINVVNVGSAVAYNISSGFYLVQVSGNQLLMMVHNVTVNGAMVDHLNIGQTGVVSAPLIFTMRGNYTVLANVTDDGELHPGDNTRRALLQVFAFPDPPTNVTASPRNVQILLTWTSPVSDGGSAITSYRVYRTLGGDSELLATVSNNTLSYVDSNVIIGTTYTYFVVATNNFGTGANSTKVSSALQSATADNTIIYAGVAIAIIAVIAIGVVVMRRKE